MQNVNMDQIKEAIKSVLASESNRDPEPVDPNRNYNFTELSKFIRNKLFGRDVREAIAKGVEKAGITSEAAIKITEQLIDGSFDEAELTTEIERRLNELEEEYAPRLTGVESQVEGLDSNMGDHISDRVKHRNVYINEEPDPDPGDYDEGDMILSPLKEQGLVVLDEVELSGVVGYANTVRIPEKYQGKIKKYELDIIGGVKGENERNAHAIMVHVNGDTGENYRVHALNWDTVNSVPTTSRAENNSGFPRTGYLGQYTPSQMKVTLMPTLIPETTSMSWISQGWLNNGSSPSVENNFIWNGGGRWQGEGMQLITHFTLRTPHHLDEWAPYTRAILTGVL